MQYACGMEKFFYRLKNNILDFTWFLIIGWYTYYDISFWPIVMYTRRTEERALSRKEILESVKESLSNLDLEYIDLVIIHKSDPHCPVEGNLIHALHYRIRFILYVIRTF